MADKAITDLVELAATPAVDDWVEIVDISEGSPADQNKKITTANLLASALTAAGNATITGTITFNPAGAAPFATTKTGVVTNFNADTVDGIHGTALAEIGATETISAVWTYSAIPVFNGGTTGASAPFTVDSTYVVANLNADLLDGLQAAAFAEIANTETIISVWTFGAAPSLEADPPMAVTQNTVVANLNADLLDGVEGENFVRSDIADAIAGVLTFNAIPAFNGGTTGASAPFTVDSTYKVTNLNADLLDGVSIAAIVQTTGAQNVAGIKTFTDGVKFNDADTVTFGTGSDSAFAFDGTDLVLTLTAGDFIIKNGASEKFKFNRVSGIFEAVDVQINT